MTADTLKRLRRENLLSLLGQYSRREICERTGLASTHISGLATDQQTVDDVTARQIERSMKLPVGWMDQPHFTASPQAEESAEALPPEERVLLAKFRQLDPAAQVHIRAIIDAFLVAKRTEGT